MYSSEFDEIKSEINNEFIVLSCTDDWESLGIVNISGSKLEYENLFREESTILTNACIPDEYGNDGCFTVGCPTFGNNFCDYYCEDVDGCQICWICRWNN